jgi:hypothetical protein
MWCGFIFNPEEEEEASVYGYTGTLFANSQAELRRNMVVYVTLAPVYTVAPVAARPLRPDICHLHHASGPGGGLAGRGIHSSTF